MDALANLGIDWKLLVAQVVNFVILLWILKRFAYQPMLRLMDERSAKIERGLQDAKRAEAKLRDIETQEQETLSAARAEAKQLLADAETAAKKRDALKLSETEERIKKLLADAEVKIEESRIRMLEQAKEELAETVIVAVEKLLKEKVDTEKDRALIEKIISK